MTKNVMEKDVKEEVRGTIIDHLYLLAATPDHSTLYLPPPSRHAFSSTLDAKIFTNKARQCCATLLYTAALPYVPSCVDLENDELLTGSSSGLRLKKDLLV